MVQNWGKVRRNASQCFLQSGTVSCVCFSVRTIDMEIVMFVRGSFQDWKYYNALQLFHKNVKKVKFKRLEGIFATAADCCDHGLIKA